MRDLVSTFLDSVQRHRSRLSAEQVAAALVAAAAGAAVHALVTGTFRYGSANHDEGVYLQQASMLYDGRLEMNAGDLAASFRPWFFVVDGGWMYPKYSPVSAAVFGLGKELVGTFSASLVLVAVCNVLLVYALAAAAFDRRTGVVAALALAGSPLFLLSSSVYLPYAPTAFFDLLFALAYVRMLRRGSLGYAALAGAAIGVAFFARPYTALLFALPFMAHGAAVLARRVGEPSLRPALARYGVLSAFGMLFVGVTLGYNHVVTGSALVFPYQAFAPHDGIGLGRREILGYSRTYDLELALRANVRVLRAFATDWFVAGPLGTTLAAVGLGAFLVRARNRVRGDAPFPDVELRAVLAGLFVSISLGNVFFWGNLNLLADLGNPNDGLIALLGPFYHFDLLLPLSAFAASAVVLAGRALVGVVRRRASPRATVAVVLAVLLVAVPVVGAVERATLQPKVDANAEITGKYAQAYGPFEETNFERALVFMPTPYGDWLNHPFQAVRNDPDLDGPAVYALSRTPAEDFAVVDVYPNRTLYRYAYRVDGTSATDWTPNPEQRAEARLRPLDVRRGDRLDGETTVGVPERLQAVTVRLDGGTDSAQYALRRSGDATENVRWRLTPDGARIVGDNVSALGEGGPVSFSGRGEVVLTVTVVQPDGGSLTYRQEISAEPVGDEVRAIWPDERSVCRFRAECGAEGTYLTDDGTGIAWASMNSTIRVNQRPNRSSRLTVTMDRAMSTPPEKGSSFVSPARSSYSMGTSRTA